MSETNAEVLLELVGVISAIFFLLAYILGPIFEWIKNQAGAGFAFIALIIFLWWLTQKRKRNTKK